jgi:hypothetical protein
MHPTADTLLFKFLKGAARRVMPGVRLLMRYSPLLIEMRDRSEWWDNMFAVLLAVTDGLTSVEVGGGRHRARRASPLRDGAA